ncbi:UDP-N-acetylglucosamine 2-epimerase (non-hydrolyzing)/GDP/UDP-N,N'-diacetylbacillosamine 2-epimerase (hydrolyzing) [Methanohalophilus levihalophilus]|uniref:UDP-N-acetylglucosamine 2-epimerase n=1 Tax=Methanohalophilus levihalophilus TaxID=1431282 RepID=UPI001AE8C3CD|nr:UDP-N-acetylglucosamine 2-epimerase [Methanohalophilus levihalophilus]MBP2029959.1 UDP-N-acetylglucosamine 2-epimerase (non-hydrolyzing)/GDP/UDP-N,N'-diacetylbacillosamine 2-epimerase (hydrolyzing) [Methanohalophilus levihalophilus]
MVRKIAVITGTRADYGLMRSTLKAIDSHPKLELCLIATGMHLSHEFGYTINDIKKDGFSIASELDILLSSDSKTSMATSAGLGIIKISQALEQIKPDIVVVEGDRWEAASGVIASAFLNIPVAHISGGDVTEGGCIDDSIRHAITKFAHIHFPGTSKSAERLSKMGEEGWRIHMVGDPGNDLQDFKSIEPQELENYFSINLNDPLLLVVQHPVTYEIEHTADHMRETMESIVELGLQTIVIYPNADSGGKLAIEVIKDFSEYPNIKIYKNLTRDVYLSLMAVSSAIIGNSSSGIVESPFFKIPAVNIGTRQSGRERSTNVIDVEYDRHEIVSAIKKALSDKDFKENVKNCPNPYASENTGIKIANLLYKIEIDNKLINKKFIL